jgi:hypothetical protein
MSKKINKKRNEFLARNKDIDIKKYLDDKNDCHLFVVTCGDFIEGTIHVSNMIVLPYDNNGWTEDRLIFADLMDVDLFIDWYKEKHNKNVEVQLEI